MITTENTTIENNQIIADFLHGKNAVHPNQYHENWNELMPVIRKCLEGEAEHNNKIAKETIKSIYEHLCDQDISGVYLSCVEFIKWYNLQNY